MMDKEKILKDLKLTISISNFEKEEKIEMNKPKNSIFKTGLVACCMVVSITGVVFAKDIGNFISNLFGANASDGINTATEQGYVVNTNTEYQDSNGIEISVKSFLLDDNNFDMTFDIKISDKYNIDDMQKLELMDLKVVNENEEKIFATRDIEAEEMQKLYKTEEEARENYDSYRGAYSGYAEKIGENELRYYLTATGNPENFPIAEKLIVTFNRIRIRNNFDSFISDENSIYTGEWKYELDVPEEMAQRNSINYNVKKINDNNIIVDKAILSNTAFKIYLSKANDIEIDNNEYVENSNGKKFEPSMRSDGDGALSVTSDGKVTYYNTFNLTKFDATDLIKVHLFKTNGKEVIIELEKEK